MMETTRSAKNTSASLVATRLHHTLITTRPEVGRRGERRGCGQEREGYNMCVYVCVCVERVTSRKERREKVRDVVKRGKEKWRAK